MAPRIVPRMVAMYCASRTAVRQALDGTRFLGQIFQLEKSTTQHRMALPCYTIMTFEPQSQKNRPKWIECPCLHKFLSAKRCVHWRVLGWPHFFSACCTLNPDSSHQFPAKNHVQKLGKKCGVEWQKIVVSSNVYNLACKTRVPSWCRGHTATLLAHSPECLTTLFVWTTNQPMLWTSPSSGMFLEAL